MSDRTGQTIAELIVGRRRTTGSAPRNDAVYPCPAPTRLLARGSLDVSGEIVDWLDRRILDIPAARIASVKLTGDGATLALSRTEPADKFAVAGAPADKKLKGPAALAEPAGALAALDLADVKPAADQPVPDSGVAAASFTTFDGLTSICACSPATMPIGWRSPPGEGRRRSRSQGDQQPGRGLELCGYAGSREAAAHPARRSGRARQRIMTVAASDAPPASPCLGICLMDPATRMCRGCLRTIDEIRAWYGERGREARDPRSPRRRRRGAEQPR